MVYAPTASWAGARLPGVTDGTAILLLKHPLNVFNRDVETMLQASISCGSGITALFLVSRVTDSALCPRTRWPSFIVLRFEVVRDNSTLGTSFHLPAFRGFLVGSFLQQMVNIFPP